MSRYRRVAWLLAAALPLGVLTPILPACVQPQCTSPIYSESECRVIAENQHARLRSSQGVEIRFQEPEAHVLLVGALHQSVDHHEAALVLDGERRWVEGPAPEARQEARPVVAVQQHRDERPGDHHQ